MKYFLIIFGIAVFIFSGSCKKNITDSLKATVVDTANIDCGYPTLSFADDAGQIYNITGKTGSVYVAKGLPDSFRIAGKKLLVEVALLSSENDFVCTTLGITYPHILIIRAIPR